MYENTIDDILKAQNRDDEAMTKIIENNSGLIWSIVKRFSGRNYSNEELYQIGCIGLIKAVQRFDVNFEVKMSTYAVPYILGEIKRFIRDDGPIKVSRSIKELAMKINYLKQEYSKKEGKEISIIEIAKMLKISKEEVAIAIDSLNQIESIDEEVYKEDGGETKESKISNNKDETNSLINKITIEQLIENLEERDKKIILLRYYNEKTQSEVAKILGITQVQVSRLEKKILISLRSRIEA
ncbi:MAG: SigB/SigF/SigG family RNA polymerase sigma factor [Clostridiales bacterium]|nr:SigB/SigF/SigG family RNA polymerase sigma factor [Clostridiales bacterium]